jgi:predicted nucleic acid-binding protein
VAAFLPDSTCLVAVVSPWHQHHHAAQAELGRRLDRGEAMFLAAPALIEAYSVLTRLPPPYRLSPAEAHHLLQTNFVSEGTVVALDERAYLDLLRRAALDGIAGGRTYDAVIAACAVGANVQALLTFNEQDFSGLTPPGLAIVVPGR